MRIMKRYARKTDMRKIYKEDGWKNKTDMRKGEEMLMKEMKQT